VKELFFLSVSIEESSITMFYQNLLSKEKEMIFDVLLEWENNWEVKVK